MPRPAVTERREMAAPGQEGRRPAEGQGETLEMRGAGERYPTIPMGRAGVGGGFHWRDASGDALCAIVEEPAELGAVWEPCTEASLAAGASPCASYDCTPRRTKSIPRSAASARRRQKENISMI